MYFCGTLKSLCLTWKNCSKKAFNWLAFASHHLLPTNYGMFATGIVKFIIARHLQFRLPNQSMHKIVLIKCSNLNWLKENFLRSGVKTLHNFYRTHKKQPDVVLWNANYEWNLYKLSDIITGETVNNMAPITITKSARAKVRA